MSRRKTYYERPPIKSVTPGIMVVFNKYLLADGKKIKFVKVVPEGDMFIFETPSKSIYVINMESFTETFTGPMIPSSFSTDKLELGGIYHIKNIEVASSLFVYKKKVVNKESYLFEDSMGVRFVINSDDINARIEKDSKEYSIIMSGDYFDT